MNNLYERSRRSFVNLRHGELWTVTDDTHGEKLKHIWNKVCRSGRERRSENMFQLQDGSQSCWSLWQNNCSDNLDAACRSTSRLQLCLAVTLSSTLINNVLILGRKQPNLAFGNSWEGRRRRGRGWVAQQEPTNSHSPCWKSGRLPPQTPQTFVIYLENVEKYWNFFKSSFQTSLIVLVLYWKTISAGRTRETWKMYYSY